MNGRTLLHWPPFSGVRVGGAGSEKSEPAELVHCLKDHPNLDQEVNNVRCFHCRSIRNAKMTCPSRRAIEGPPSARFSCTESGSALQLGEQGSGPRLPVILGNQQNCENDARDSFQALGSGGRAFSTVPPNRLDAGTGRTRDLPGRCAAIPFTVHRSPALLIPLDPFIPRLPASPTGSHHARKSSRFPSAVSSPGHRCSPVPRSLASDVVGQINASSKARVRLIEGPRATLYAPKADSTSLGFKRGEFVNHAGSVVQLSQPLCGVAQVAEIQVAKGSNAGKGAMIGAGALGTALALLAVADRRLEDSFTRRALGSTRVVAVFTLVGSGIGALIGSTQPAGSRCTAGALVRLVPAERGSSEYV